MKNLRIFVFYLFSWFLIWSKQVHSAAPRYLMYTVAGTGSYGTAADGAVATSSRINVPYQIFVSNDDLYFCDHDNYRIRKVSSASTGLGLNRVFVGTGGSTSSGDGGQASSASVASPTGIWGDSAGNIYFSDYSAYKMKKVAVNGIISNFAGTGDAGGSTTSSNGDGGPATSATIYQTNYLTGSSGNFGNFVYLADGGNNKVRRIDINTGIMTLVAGTGSASSSGSGYATSATFYKPQGVHFDTLGQLYITEFAGNKVRKVATNQIVSVFAGTGSTSYSAASGLPATSSFIKSPNAVWADTTGNVFIADMGNARLRMVDPGLLIYSVAGDDNNVAVTFQYNGAATSISILSPDGVYGDADGRVFVGDSLDITGGCSIRGLYTNTDAPTTTPTYVPTISPSRVPSATPSIAPTAQPTAVPTMGPTIRPSATPTATPTNLPTIVPSQVPTTLPTTTPSASPSALPSTLPTVAPTILPSNVPTKVPSQVPTMLPTTTPSVSPSILPSTQPTVVLTVAPSNVPTKIPSLASTTLPSLFPTVAPTVLPTVLLSAPPSILPSVAQTAVPSATPSVVPSTAPTTLPSKQPTLTPNSLPSTNPSQQPTQAPTQAPSIVASIPPPSPYQMTTFAGTGLTGAGQFDVSATSSALNKPAGMFYSDTTGVLYVADSGNYRVKALLPDGIIVSFAGGTIGGTSIGPATSALFMKPFGLWGDSQLNVYVSDSGANCVRKVDHFGTVTTVVGTGFASSLPTDLNGDGEAATSATLKNPLFISGDSANSLYIVDNGNYKLRRVDFSTQIITTIAGTGVNNGVAANGLYATSAKLYGPIAVFVDTVGRVFVSESSGNRVRVINTAGIMTTVAGNGGVAVLENIPATSSGINAPLGIWVDTINNLCIVSSEQYRVRVVTNGLLYTIAGNGDSATALHVASGDALSIPLLNPSGLYGDKNGHLVVSDMSTALGGSVVRLIEKTATTAPSLLPSAPPIAPPSVQPTAQPSAPPSSVPTTVPSITTDQPTAPPSVLPSTIPSNLPSTTPSILPSTTPSILPSTTPSILPSTTPSILPSVPPTLVLTTTPSCIPSTVPSTTPSSIPTLHPTVSPTTTPTGTTSVQPSVELIVSPTTGPSATSTPPSNAPSFTTSSTPSHAPSVHTHIPVFVNTASPSISPTDAPSKVPTETPSSEGTSDAPSDTPNNEPSMVPTETPSSEATSIAPTIVLSDAPSEIPTASPSVESTSNAPNNAFSDVPSDTPSQVPTEAPSSEETNVAPSTAPSDLPTESPSDTPSNAPSKSPSDRPSNEPSKMPTQTPSSNSTETVSDVSPSPAPSSASTILSSVAPSVLPTTVPSIVSSMSPSVELTEVPNNTPSMEPIESPTEIVSAVPTSTSPSIAPSTSPSIEPSGVPSVKPSIGPSEAEVTASDQPTILPTLTTVTPTMEPTSIPSIAPSSATTVTPSELHTIAPTVAPTSAPTTAVSLEPHEVISYAAAMVAGSTNSGAPYADQLPIDPTSPVLATEVQLHSPQGLFIDTTNIVYVVDLTDPIAVTGKVYQIENNILTVFAGSSSDNENTAENNITPNIAATSVSLSYPSGVWCDTDNNIYLTESYSHIIRKINTNRQISIIAGTYNVNSESSGGLNGDGGSATSSTLYGPTAIFGDSNGFIYFADSYNNKIRSIKLRNNVIRTVAGTGDSNLENSDNNINNNQYATSVNLANPQGVWVDSTGRVFISDTGSNLIRMVTTARTIETVADGSASALDTNFGTPKGICGDSAGNLYFAERNRASIRVIYATTDQSNQKVDIIAINTPNATSTAQGLALSEINIRNPSGVQVDSSGGVYFSDDNWVRLLYPATTKPTATPTKIPSEMPSLEPSVELTNQPSTVMPSISPTDIPSQEPTQSPSWLPTTETPSMAPSQLPTLHPSVVPTMSPTVAPSSPPTIKPTTTPSAKPSTSVPSTYPTTAKPSRTPSVSPTPLPTVFSSLQAPSFRPTAQPTLSSKSQWTNALQSALYVQSSGSSAAHQSTYYELLVTDAYPKNVYGSCTSWSSLLYGDLSASIYTYKPSSISMSVSESLSAGVASVTCSDAAKVTTLLNFLTKSTSTFGTSVTAACDSHNWIAKMCTAGGKKALCVDCSDPCAAASHCKKTTVGTGASSTVSNFPFVIAPCVSDTCSGTTELSALRVLTVSYDSIQTAPEILSMETTSDRTSITISTRLSAQGTVYCGAFLHLNVPKSVDEIIVQNFVSATQGSLNTSTVIISGVSAVNRYEVYCLTSSSVGVKMSVQKMLNTRTVVSTACCKIVTATLSSSVLQESTNPVNNMLSLSLDAFPSGSLQMKLVVTNKATNTVLTNGFFPSTFTVNSVQSSKSFAASLYSLLPGVYTYALVLSGTSASEYEVVYGSKEFRVLSASVPPPAPVLSSVVFSNEGTSITIKFDSSTNKAGTAIAFNCGKVFDFLCATSSNCLWTDAATVEAKIINNDTNSCVAANGTVTVRPSVALKAACVVTTTNDCSQQSAWHNASSTVKVYVQSPAAAVLPTVVIAPRNVIGACDSLTIDFTASYGSGGRDWVRPTIVVTSSDTLNETNTADIQHWLDTEYRASPPNAIPQSLLVVGTTYNFVVTLCNFLGKCGQNNLKVTVISADVPSVTLPGEPLRTMTRSQVFSVVSEATISSCGSVVAATNLGLSYRWSVSVDSVPVLGLVSSSQDPSKLLLSSYALQTNTQYEMTLFVTTISTSQTASASVKVLVIPGVVEARITGGSTRSVRVGQNIVIDASTSRDDDQQGIYGTAAGLQFSWSCTQTFPSYAETCQSIFDYDATSGDQMLTVTAKESASNAIGVLTVTVFDSTGQRSSQVAVTITVLPALAALLSLTSTLSSTVKMNAGQVLKLTGSVGLPAGKSGNVTWSVDDSTSFNLISAAQSAVTTRLPASTSDAPRNIYMAFAANSLPVGATLTFALSCVISNSNVESVAKLTVNVNSPPQPGTFYVDPPSGAAVETPFIFVAEKWTDVDMPITYQFGYHTTSGAVVVLRSQKAVSFGEMTLIAGAESKGRVLSCVAQIFDSLEADSVVSFPVTVQPGVEKSADEKSSFITDSLYQGSGSADGRKLSTAMASYLLNVVNCTAAPNCAALNRADCSKTRDTCGACISGYVGEVGDSNSACVDASAAHDRRMLFSSDGSCTQAADFSSVFASCVAGQCVVPDKTCPNGCSGHGTCSFISAFNATQTLSRCAIDDLGCVAMCDCDEDYSLSTSCAVNNADMEAFQASREAVLSSIVALTEIEDPSEQSVSGLISLVSIATQNTDELSSVATGNALSAISTVVDNAASIGVSVGTVEPVLDAMNSVVTSMSNQATARRRRLISTDDSASKVALVQTLLKKYSAHIASTLLPGMSAVSSAQSQFKLSTQYVSSEMSVSLPLTSLEALSGAASNSVTLPENSTAFTAVSVMSVQSQLYGDSGNSSKFISNPLNLLLSSLPCASPPCEVRIVLQNTQPITVIESIPEQHNTTCFVGESVAHNYTCSNGYVLNNITCDGERNYAIHSKCPVTNYSPVCNTLAGAAASEKSGCRVVDFSDSSVTCGCLIGSGSKRRALQSTDTNSDGADDNSYSVSYVSMLKATVKSFVNTFSSAENLNATSAENGWDVIVTIGVFAGAIIVSLVLSHNADVREKTTKELKKEERTERNERKSIIRQTLDKVSNGSNTPRSLRKNNSKAIKALTTDKIVNAELAMVEQSLPKILSSSQSFSEKFYAEVKQHHRWLGVVFFFSESFPRALRVASLATNVIIMLFIQSIFYNLTNPDDGTCETYLSPSDCAAPRSAFATGESKCEWSADHNTCTFLQPDGSMKIVLFVAIFSAIISTPIALGADWVMHKIVSAPVLNTTRRRATSSFSSVMPLENTSNSVTTRAAESTTTVTTTTSRNETRRSHTSHTQSPAPSRRRNSLFAMLGLGHNLGTKVTNYQLELTKLANEVRKHREKLNEQQRNEFDLLWGLDENGCFKTGESTEGGVWSKLFGFKDSKTPNVHQAVLNDLKQVEETVTRELDRYPIDSNPDSGVTMERKRLNHKLSKRLLFLFQCDLLPGISGQILQSKSQRDTYRIEPVSKTAKIVGILSLVLLNTGMLFYIFLFALQQSNHRQSAWFQSFMVWLIVEILVVSTAVVFLMNVVIPSLIMKDVTKIKNRLLDNIRDFHANIANKASNKYGENKEHFELVEEQPFNAAKYLFVSTRVAAQHPELREAAIISQFTTPWPKQSYQHVVDTSKAYSKKFTAISRSASIVVMFFVTNLLNVPPSLQDMVVHMVTTTSIGYTALLHIELFGIFPLLAFGPFIVLCVIAHFVIQSGKANAKKRLAQLLPKADAKPQTIASVITTSRGTSNSFDASRTNNAEHNTSTAGNVNRMPAQSFDTTIDVDQIRYRTLSELVGDDVWVETRGGSFDLNIHSGNTPKSRARNVSNSGSFHTPVSSPAIATQRKSITTLNVNNSFDKNRSISADSTHNKHIDRRTSLAQGVQVLQNIQNIHKHSKITPLSVIHDSEGRKELWDAPLSDSDIDPAELEEQREAQNDPAYNADNGSDCDSYVSMDSDCDGDEIETENDRSMHFKTLTDALRNNNNNICDDSSGSNNNNSNSMSSASNSTQQPLQVMVPSTNATSANKVGNTIQSTNKQQQQLQQQQLREHNQTQRAIYGSESGDYLSDFSVSSFESDFDNE